MDHCTRKARTLIHFCDHIEEPIKGIPNHMKPDLSAGRPYYSFTAYGQSKTANILHAVSLNQKLKSKGIRAFAVHPGSIWTDFSRNLSEKDLQIIEGTSTFWKDQDQGCATNLAAAFDPELSTDNSGRVLLSDCKLDDVSDYAKDPEIAERLWQLSETLTESSSKL
jgi:NAD(P)-dependent dehydrogenase (short-subunit alcohol dehydrogenase family)